MTPGQSLRALIFDFDGVLADTEDLHCAAFQATAASLGLTLSRHDYYHHFLGLPDRDCLAALCERDGKRLTPRQLDELAADKRARFATLSATAGLYPGVADTLRVWHQQCLLAVASGAFRDEIETILVRNEVRDLFTVIVGAEDVRAGKPAPDPFLQALKAIERQTRTSISPTDCLVIEDSPAGIVAAHAAGMRCVAVTTNHDPATLASADAVISDLRDLRPESLPLQMTTPQARCAKATG